MSLSRNFLTIAIFGLALSAGSLRAQVADAPPPVADGPPAVPDVTQRSGLFTRHVPARITLPYDPQRDLWQNTRWADPHESKWINSPCNGGLYGRFKWAGDCTACYSPYFRGNPGQSSLNGPDCPPAKGRLIANMLHPFKPVSYYYAGGCYVPIYDLDSMVPGPGPYPWSHLYRVKPIGD